MEGLEGEINHRTLTYTLWKSGTGKERERQGWHPMTFKHSDATGNLIKDIKVQMKAVNFLLFICCLSLLFGWFCAKFMLVIQLYAV